ncbi:MAG TPA: PAS domain-containing sensor histidine kinase [bacterium]|nr:PAS domain-containing sensor histidine kinase [bacterium]HNS33719.1 PAS domain-containing sensor histidine kinase [bacterium]HNW09200.1 PAS domain-containing sensor histidine kinase [bacterium]HNZ73378.1 PAS domain-containing sensor histidine kinase [bacterium]HOH67249.1 PAS domain-containing sensor histidine kinase [bacterium]
MFNRKNKKIDQEIFPLILENISDCIVVTDQEGMILYANRALEKTTGFKVKEVLGKKAGSNQLWGGLMDKKFYEHLWQTVKVRKIAFAAELENKRKNGEKYDALLRISPVLDTTRRIKYFISVEKDITQEKAIDRSKTEFVSLASHQLRTPLSAINWYAEMMLNGDIGGVNKELKEYLKEIYDGNQRMIELVNDLLNVSRVDLGTIEINIEKVDVVELAEDVLGDLAPKIKLKNVKLIKDYDARLKPIKSDAKFLRIIFQNLLSNAVKYNRDQGKVYLTIAQKGLKLFIEIRDTGMGIPQHQQHKIFTRLFRADNAKEKVTEGSGLGLYLIKLAVEKGGGKIWFDSQEGKGTAFFIELPIDGWAKAAKKQEKNKHN